jgi:hypothetical protein
VQWAGYGCMARFCGDLSYSGEGKQCSIESIQVSILGVSGDKINLTISNGASPVALWLGHLLWELPPIILISTLVTIIFATVSSQFAAIGYVWFCLLLYGICSTLYSFMFALFLTSPLASWALVAGSNVILFMLYL